MERDMIIDQSEDTDFVKFWNSVLKRKFTRYRHILQGGLSRHSGLCCPSCPSRKDVGAGCWLWLGRPVAPGGGTGGTWRPGRWHRLRRCISRRSPKGCSCQRFVERRVLPRRCRGRLPENEFDYVVARFGTMLFANPVGSAPDAPRAEARRAETHIVWRRREDNPAWQEAKEITLRHLPPPVKMPIPAGPVRSRWATRRPRHS